MMKGKGMMKAWRDYRYRHVVVVAFVIAVVRIAFVTLLVSVARKDIRRDRG